MKHAWSILSLTTPESVLPRGSSFKKKKNYPTPSAFLGFLGGSVVKNPPANVEGTRDMDAIPGLGRFPGEGNGNPTQYSCLDNSMDRGVWQSMGLQRVRHNWVAEHTHTHTHTLLAVPKYAEASWNKQDSVWAVWLPSPSNLGCPEHEWPTFANDHVCQRFSRVSCVSLWGFWNSYTLLKEIALKKWSYI